MFAETIIILLVMLVAVLGPAIVIAVLGRAIIKALARNPSAAGKYFFALIFCCIFVEAISIISMLIIFQLFGK